MSKMLAQQLDIVFRAGGAVVRVVQKEFNAVEDDAKPRAVPSFHGGPEMVEEGFDFTPVDIRTDRVGENGVQQMGMLVAHGIRSARQNERPDIINP